MIDIKIKNVSGGPLVIEEIGYTAADQEIVDFTSYYNDDCEAVQRAISDSRTSLYAQLNADPPQAEIVAGATSG